MRVFFSLLLVGFTMATYGQTEQQPKVKASDKPRTIVTTDGEIDDVDSFIRMLLYANEFKIEGLVTSSSMWHYKGDGKGTLFTPPKWKWQKRCTELSPAFAGRIHCTQLARAKDFL